MLFLDKDRARRGFRGIVTSTETAASSCLLLCPTFLFRLPLDNDVCLFIALGDR